MYGSTEINWLDRKKINETTAEKKLGIDLGVQGWFKTSCDHDNFHGDMIM